MSWHACPYGFDALWSLVAPLLPVEPAKPKGGRPRIDDRAALTGILFVLRSGIPWEMLPQEMACGSGVTCWRRLRDWQAAGVWNELHRELLRRLHQADRLDWSRACLDSSSIAAKMGLRRLVPLQPTAVGRGPNAISSQNGKASRSPFC